MCSQFTISCRAALSFSLSLSTLSLAESFVLFVVVPSSHSRHLLHWMSLFCVQQCACCIPFVVLCVPSFFYHFFNYFYMLFVCVCLYFLCANFWKHIVEDRWQVLTLTIFVSFYFAKFSRISFSYIYSIADMPSLYVVLLFLLNSLCIHAPILLLIFFAQTKKTTRIKREKRQPTNLQKSLHLLDRISVLRCNDTSPMCLSSISLTECVRELWTECEFWITYKNGRALACARAPLLLELADFYRFERVNGVHWIYRIYSY